MEELTSLIVEGFITTDLVVLLKQDGQKIDDKDRKVVERAMSYLKLVRRGKQFVEKDEAVDDLEKSLRAYNTAITAIKSARQGVKLSEFNDLLEATQIQLCKTLFDEKVSSNEVKEAFFFFSSVRDFLLRKSSEMNNNSLW